MLSAIFFLVIGFLLLTIGADRLVTGASATAKTLGVPTLLIGLTIVALGTSAPEIFVAITASIKDNAELAIGNTLGSNIANIGLVLGITALIKPLQVASGTLKREYPILFCIMLVTWLLINDAQLDRADGVVLIIGLFMLMGWMINQGMRKRNKEPLIAEFEHEIPTLRTPIAILWLILGIALLPIGSKIIVDSAVSIAEMLGVSNLVIGLTIVAIGTSLPELAATIASTIKNEPDIAIGNILGSNMFNLLAVLPFPGLIRPGSFDHNILTRDLPTMFGMTLLLFIAAYGFRGRPGHVNRWEGAMFLMLYLGYVSLLF